MAGLEKIIERIQVNSAANCDAILQDAQKQADTVRAAKKAEADAAVEKITADTKRQAKEIIDAAVSGSELEEKKQLLAEKVDLINGVIDNVTNTLKNLPDEQYFDSLYALVIKYARSEDGVMYLSQKDLDRLPKDFEKTVNEQIKGGTIKVSKEPRDLDGGFVLAYGGIEINCSFDALVADNRENIKDELSRIIFA